MLPPHPLRGGVDAPACGAWRWSTWCFFQGFGMMFIDKPCLLTRGCLCKLKEPVLQVIDGLFTCCHSTVSALHQSSTIGSSMNCGNLPAWVCWSSVQERVQATPVSPACKDTLFSFSRDHSWSGALIPDYINQQTTETLLPRSPKTISCSTEVKKIPCWFT